VILRRRDRLWLIFLFAVIGVSIGAVIGQSFHNGETVYWILGTGGWWAAVGAFLAGRMKPR
jgi:hypothetical protein